MQNPGTGHRSAELWDIGAERKIFLAGRTLAAGFTQRKRIILVWSANYDFANSLPNFSDTICWGLCDDVFPHTSELKLHHDKMFNMSANIEMLEMQSKHDKLGSCFSSNHNWLWLQQTPLAQQTVCLENSTKLHLLFGHSFCVEQTYHFLFTFTQNWSL